MDAYMLVVCRPSAKYTIHPVEVIEWRENRLVGQAPCHLHPPQVGEKDNKKWERMSSTYR